MVSRYFLLTTHICLFTFCHAELDSASDVGAWIMRPFVRFRIGVRNDSFLFCHAELDSASDVGAWIMRPFVRFRIGVRNDSFLFCHAELDSASDVGAWIMRLLVRFRVKHGMTSFFELLRHCIPRNDICCWGGNPNVRTTVYFRSHVTVKLHDAPA